MNNDKPTGYVVRDAVLKLLSDEEIVRDDTWRAILSRLEALGA